MTTNFRGKTDSYHFHFRFYLRNSSQ